MIRRLYWMLPGPTPLRVAISVVILVIALIGLLFLYDWIGKTYLDQGGAVG